MWIFTKHGFFSCTNSTYEAGKFNIRARSVGHLEALIKAHGQLLGRCKILQTKQADYRWRIMLKPETWHKLALRLAEEVDYSNFKNECHAPGAGAGDIGGELMSIWHTMNSYQRGGDSGDGYDDFLDFRAARKHSRAEQERFEHFPPDPEPEPEPEPEPHDYSDLIEQLQNAGDRGCIVRPELEGLPEGWITELDQALIGEESVVEQLDDDLCQVKLMPLEAAQTPPEQPDLTEAPAQAAPRPGSRAAALGAEQLKLDAILAEERAKTADGKLHDRGPGEKPHRPETAAQQLPDLGVGQTEPPRPKPAACPACHGNQIKKSPTGYTCAICLSAC